MEKHGTEVGLIKDKLESSDSDYDNNPEGFSVVWEWNSEKSLFTGTRDQCISYWFKLKVKKASDKDELHILDNKTKRFVSFVVKPQHKK